MPNDNPREKNLTSITLAGTLGNEIVSIFNNQLLEPAMNESSAANEPQSVDDQQPSTSRETTFPLRDISSMRSVDNQGVNANRVILGKRKPITDCEDHQRIKKPRFELHNVQPHELQPSCGSNLDSGRTGPGENPNSDEAKSGTKQNQSSRFNREMTHPAGGLKSFFPGVVYQLKHLGLTLFRAMQQKISVLLSTERVDVGKFDDLVLEYRDNQGKDVALFLQLKHSRSVGRQVNAYDLLEKEDGDFFVPKYFMSWREIKKSPLFSGKVSRNVVLGTNIGLNLEGLRNAEMSFEEVSKPVECLEMIGTKEETACYKLTANVQSNPMIYTKLKETSDVHMLARELAEHVVRAKPMTLVGMFKQYHTALGEHVIDTKNKKFLQKFIKNEDLPPKTRDFRKIFFVQFSKLKSRSSKHKVAEDVIWKEVEDSSLKLLDDFGKTFKKPVGPLLTDVTLFSQEFVKLLNNATNDKVVKVSRNIYRKNARKGSVERVVADNIDKLAWHVLITKCEKIKFRTQFSDDGNIGEFKDSLKSQLGSTYDELDRFEFEINNFKTCEEKELYPNTELPDGDIAEVDITEFLNVFILAVNLPDEVELGEMITDEIGDYRKFNLLDADLIGRTFLTKIEDWFKKEGEKVGEGEYLSYTGGEGFFKEIENQMNTLKSMGVTSVYWEELNEYDIHFKCENVRLNAFLSENEPNSTLHRILMLMAPRETFLTTLRVHQTLVQQGKFAKNDSFIFIRLRTLSLQGIKDQVLQTFQSPRSHHLLVIECNSASMKQNLRGLWRSLCKAVRKVNDANKTVILIARGDKDLGTSLAGQFEPDLEPHIQKDDTSFGSLTKDSQQKILEKWVVKFQGCKDLTSFGRLLDLELDNIGMNELNDVSEILDANTLVSLIRGDDEIRIGNDLEGLDEVEHYYIHQKIFRHIVAIKKDIFQDRGSLDILVISGINKESLGNVGRIGETLLMDRNLNSEQEVEYFETSCARNPNRNIHWLREESGKYIWKQSVGDKTYLLRYRDTNENDAIEKDIFQDRGSLDILVISGIHKESLGNVGRIGETLLMDRNLNSEQEVEYFETLCAQKPNRNIHWLREESGKYIWKKSVGDKTYLLRYRDTNENDGIHDRVGATYSSEDRNVVHDGPVIVSNTAGMGKSTLFTYLARNLTETESDLLVLKIDLNRHTNALAKVTESKYNLSDPTEAVKFLLEKLLHLEKGLENKVFKAIIEKQRRTALIFDGFDEISPHYENIVIDLLDALSKHTGIRKLFVATRPHTRGILEKRLKTFSHALEPFSTPEQKLFLINFWRNELGLEESDQTAVCRLQMYADAILAKLANSIGDRMNEFTGIPLQTKLVAEIFKNRMSWEQQNLTSCKEFIDSTEDEPNLPNKFDLIFLYKNFVEMKYEFFFNKRECNRSDPAVMEDREKCRKEFINTHKNLAMNALFDEDTVNAFLPVRTEVHFVVERTGIINNMIEGKPHFGHRTYAEYFAADFLSDKLKEGIWNPSVGRIFLADILLKENYRTLRAFLNDLLPVEDNDVRDCESWKYDWKDYRSENDETILHVASREGNHRIIQLFLHHISKNSEYRIALINAEDYDGFTAAEIAVRFGYINIVELLRKHGNIDLNSTFNRGTTLLHRAVQNNQLNVVRYLVGHKVDVQSQDINGETPLFLAAINGNLDLVRYLVEHKADVQSQNERGETPLSLAAEFGHSDVVRYLIEHKADVQSQDKRGETPLLFAIRQGELETVIYLHEQGADIQSRDEKGRTPLSLAAEWGSLDMLRYLVKHGADVRSQDKSGETPLSLAAKRGNLDIVRYLHGERADVQSQNKRGETPLSLAAEWGSLDMLRYLVKHGADVRSQDKSGETPLSLAAKRGNWDIVRYLHGEGADVQSQNKRGETPLSFAAVRGNSDMVRYLVKHGADVRSQNKRGETPLSSAAVPGKLETVIYLHGLGADIQSRDDEGWTPLSLAAMHGHSDVVRYLVEHKADIESRDNEGRTPLSLAAMPGNPYVIRCLIEGGIDVLSPNKRGETLLFFAAINGRSNTVWHLFEHGADVLSSNKREDTLLFLAAMRGKLETVIYLHQQGAEIQSRDEEGKTPLSLAVMRGNSDVVQYLVKHKADIKSRDKEGRTPLSLAAMHGNSDVVRYLVKHKADIKSRDKEGRTPLSLAAMHGDSDIVRYLHGEGADIESRDKEGRTPLSLAAINGNSDLVRYLNEHEADIESQDKEGRTPLSLAAMHGNSDVVRYLVKHKADIKSRDKEGRTPLSLAAMHGDSDIVRYLHGEGADIESRDKEGRTPLSLAAINGNSDLVRYLNEHEADIESQDKEGRTPLSLAAMHRNLDVVRYLVEHKADIKSRDKEGRTPLSLAVTPGDWDIVRYLHREGADIESRDKEGRTPLSLAAINGNSDLVRYLDKHEADIETRDKEGRTPLSLAAMHRNLNVVRYLVEHKADIKSRDKEGRTPLSLAVMRGNLLIVRYLHEHGADLHFQDKCGKTPLSHSIDAD